MLSELLLSRIQFLSLIDVDGGRPLHARSFSKLCSCAGQVALRSISVTWFLVQSCFARQHAHTKVQSVLLLSLTVTGRYRFRNWYSGCRLSAIKGNIRDALTSVQISFSVAVDGRGLVDKLTRSVHPNEFLANVCTRKCSRVRDHWRDTLLVEYELVGS